MIDTKRDIEIIDAATRGVWHGNEGAGIYAESGQEIASVWGHGIEQNLKNRDHIIRFNPAYLREYISKVEALTAQFADRDAEVVRLRMERDAALFRESEMVNKENDAILMAQALADLNNLVGEIPEVKQAMITVGRVVADYQHLSTTQQEG
jgi:hypothetical protein